VGFSPHDKALGLSDSVYSEGLQREMVWLCSQVPYEQGRQIAERLGGWHVPTGSMWNITQRRGERMVTVVERQQRQVSLERTAWENRRYVPTARKAVSMDGGMVNVRGQGWKELKVGLVADIPALKAAAEDGQVHLTNLRYCGLVGDVAAFESALWALAVECDIPYAGLVVVTADGAAWIWRLCADYFPCAQQVVDWFHACQHLAQAALARFPDDPTAAQHWTEDLKALLFKGEIHLILEQFDQHGLNTYANYFSEHARRMQYAQFRADGLPIGSGGVESGVKQFKQRLTGPGMRWSRPALDRMVILRSAVLSETFDQLWEAA
jgi:hypothetical protein